MRTACVTDAELVMALDGELAPTAQRRADAHFKTCWRCRGRRAQFERSIEDFIGWYSAMPAPPVGSIALLRGHMASLELAGGPQARQRSPGWKSACLGAAAVAACVAGIVIWGASGSLTAASPDPQYTPGLAIPVTIKELCQQEFADERPVSPQLARQVFARYGIEHPEGGRYEVDYRITPALGGCQFIVFGAGDTLFAFASAP